ncbi:chloroplast chlorophyll synthase [Chrysochromulina tobinii]|uniref:Chloroplast chlorophyll synthase n=1 Tax=Chrysochromulina tobinii TaxID=1460289 RepID=A0A0M0J7A5_9EUKA|nr:chloroplast chlorophyll synthase [Chrysochromulina tobinii]|eukprot:KOO22459.1 chloroplast chlorophyll synthase [Chrysochromulina sp. CCMP291]
MGSCAWLLAALAASCGCAGALRAPASTAMRPARPRLALATRSVPLAMQQQPVAAETNAEAEDGSGGIRQLLGLKGAKEATGKEFLNWKIRLQLTKPATWVPLIWGRRVRRGRVRQLPCGVEPLRRRADDGQLGSRGRGHHQGALRDGARWPVHVRLHADHQRLVRPRARRDQRALSANPIGQDQAVGGVLADRVLDRGRPAARQPARWLGGQRLARHHRRRHLWRLHGVHLLGAAAQAQVRGLAGHVRARLVVHCTAVVVRARHVRRRLDQPAGDRAHHPLLDRRPRHRHRKRLQVHRGRSGSWHELAASRLWHRHGQVDLRRLD